MWACTPGFPLRKVNSHHMNQIDFRTQIQVYVSDRHMNQQENYNEQQFPQYENVNIIPHNES